jgi:hypothetical protein
MIAPYGLSILRRGPALDKSNFTYSVQLNSKAVISWGLGQLKAHRMGIQIRISRRTTV